MRKSYAFASLVYFLFFSCFAASASAKSINILVHPFENTGNKEHSWISAGMTDTVIADLARMRNINVVSHVDRKKILEEMKFIFSGLVEEDKMIKLGKLTGANIIFTGSYLVAGDRIRVHARLISVESGKVENTTKLDGTLSGIFDLQDKVVFTLLAEAEKVQIADVTPVKVTTEVKQRIETKPKPKVAAYEWYAKGLDMELTNPREALANFNKALDIDSDYIQALIHAGLVTAYSFSLSEKAKTYLDRAETIFERRNETNTVEYANFKYIKGFAYWTMGRFDEAQNDYSTAQAVYERLGMQNTSEYAELMASRIVLHWRWGQYEQAMEYFSKARTIYEQLGLQNTAKYADLMQNAGFVYNDMKKHNRALENFSKAQSLYDRNGLRDSIGYFTTLMGIGTAYLRKDEPDKAMDYIAKAQALSEKLALENSDLYGSLMMLTGLIYKEKGQLDRAMEYYTKTQAIYDRLELQNTVNYGHLLMCFGGLYHSKGRVDLFGKYMRMAYKTYVKAGHVGPNKAAALKYAESTGY